MLDYGGKNIMANFLVRLIALLILVIIGIILYPLGAFFWFIGAIGYIVEKVCLTTGKGLFKGVNEAIAGLWKEMTGTSTVKEAFEEPKPVEKSLEEIAKMNTDSEN